MYTSLTYPDLASRFSPKLPHVSEKLLDTEFGIKDLPVSKQLTTKNAMTRLYASDASWKNLYESACALYHQEGDENERLYAQYLNELKTQLQEQTKYIRSEQYQLTDEIKIPGKPYLPGGVRDITLSPNLGAGIQFMCGEKKYNLSDATLLATTNHGARYLSLARDDGTKIAVVEHILSALVLALGWNPDVLIKLELSGWKASLLTQTNISALKTVFFPVQGPGLLRPYNDMTTHKTIDPAKSSQGRILGINSTYLHDFDHKNHGGVDYMVTKNMNKVTYQARKNPDCAITFSQHPSRMVTIKSGSHRDVSCRSCLEPKPFSVQGLHALSQEMLAARPMARITKNTHYLGYRLLRMLGGHGISEENYFLAKPNTSAEQLIQQMYPGFQEEKNELFAHTVISDLNAEMLTCVVRHMQGFINDIAVHVDISNAKHPDRVGILTQAYKDNLFTVM